MKFNRSRFSVYLNLTSSIFVGICAGLYKHNVYVGAAVTPVFYSLAQASDALIAIGKIAAIMVEQNAQKNKSG